MKDIFQKRLLLLLFCGISFSLSAQKVEKIMLSPSSEEAYLAVYPETPAKAMLVLVGSFGETPEEVLQNTQIPSEAAKNGILTIIPVFSTGSTSIGFDSETQESFQKIVEFALKKHQLQKMPFFAGGFSIGGTAVIKYAELAQDQTYQPAAVFAVDPPLDMQRLYNSAKRDIRLSIHKKPSPESAFLVQRLAQEFGGNPQEVPQNYYKASPYSFQDSTQLAVKKLIDVPLRLYTEPDLEFYLSKGMDLYAMNAFDASALINELQRLGSSKAELMVSHNKGFREPEHVKNPHSWSIVDASELVTWLLKQM